jgi:hypothetical protein
VSVCRVLGTAACDNLLTRGSTPKYSCLELQDSKPSFTHSVCRLDDDLERRDTNQLDQKSRRFPWACSSLVGKPSSFVHGYNTTHGSTWRDS